MQGPERLTVMMSMLKKVSGKRNVVEHFQPPTFP